MNSKRRQKMQLLKEDAKDARQALQTWTAKYAVLADSINTQPAEPAPPDPLTRPDEPPVGTFFRVERTGLAYVRMDNDEFGYVHAAARGCHRWVTITEPGDTWTRLELMEVRG